MHMCPRVVVALVRTSCVECMRVTLLNCSKCSKYNPNESTKQFDKSVVRKQAVLFSPTTVLEHLRGERATTGRAAGKTKEDLRQLYMQVCVGGGGMRGVFVYGVLTDGKNGR